MSRKHNTKHRRSPSNYPKRLADRGLVRTPVMPFTGLSTQQLQAHFATLPHYKWVEYIDTDPETGRKTPRMQRKEIR